MSTIWKIGRVARLEYLRSARRPIMLIATLLPLFWYGLLRLTQVALILTAFTSGERPSSELLILDLPPTREVESIGVVDEEGVITFLASSLQGRVVVFREEAAGRQALFDQPLRSLFVLAEDYLASGNVTAYVTDDTPAARLQLREDAEIVRGVLAETLIRQGGGADAALLARASEPLRPRAVVLNEASPPPVGPTLSPQQRLNRFLLAYFLILLMGFPSGYLLHSVSEEKETRVIEIVLSSVTTTELLAGKLLGLVSLGLTQMGLWLLAALTLNRGTRDFLMEISAQMTMARLVLVGLFWLLGCLLYGTLSVVAGSLGANKRDSQQMLGSLLVFLPMPVLLMGIVGALLPETLNGRAAQALSLFPLTTPTMMMIRLLLGETTAIEIMSTLTLLLLSIAMSLWLGGKLFRLGLLTLGKRPTLRQMGQALKQS